MAIMKISGHTQMTTFARHVNPNADSSRRGAEMLSAMLLRLWALLRRGGSAPDHLTRPGHGHAAGRNTNAGAILVSMPHYYPVARLDDRVEDFAGVNPSYIISARDK